MPDIGDQIGEIGGVIRTMLGLTRHSRLRDQIRGTIDLYELTSKHDALAAASSDLAEIITQQTSRLVETSSATGRQWNWGSFIVSWVIGAAFAVAAYYLAPNWGTWWATLAIVVSGLAGSLFVLVGLIVLFQKKAAEA